MGKYFGTDGFRGEANVVLTVEHAFKVGRYLGWYFGREKKARIVIGKDTRRSSYMFEYALASGLTASGADAYLLHVTTTPSVSYVVRTEDFDCGIMISASHNPFYDNGIKVINGQGHKIEAEVEEQIEAYIDGKTEELPLAVGEHIGRTVDYAAGRNRYIGHLISLATRSFKDMKIGLDCANGSSSSIAKSVYDALGAKTYVISNEPDGVNINTNCGSTHIEKLQAFVKEKNLDVGFAYDGDADRCIAVDENGNVVDGDLILYVCGKYLMEQGRYTSIRNSIDKVNKDVSVNICRWAFPGTWAKDVATSWRISGDINAHWGSLRYVVGKNLYLSAYAKDGYYNDMDMMVIGFRDNSKVGGKGLTPTEEEAHFGLWCIMSSPLLIGCNLESLPESSLELLTNKELIALNQDPLGLQAYVAQHENEGYVLVKDIEQKRGNVRAVALYNPSDTVCSFSVPFSALEFGGNVKVRDLAKRSDLGNFSDVFEQTLPAHSAMFLRMEGETRLEPTLYEAEWAYLPMFNDLGKNPKGIIYAADQEASGKMKVGFLGGQPENYAEWSEVYSADGGRYQMTVHYSFGKGRQLEIDVNGIVTKIDSLGEDDKHNQVTIPVDLKAGYNHIRMGNSYNWAPDIDCFTLTKGM